MARPRLQIEIHAPQADLVWARDQVKDQLVGKDIHDRPRDWMVGSSQRYDGEKVVVGHIRLNSKAEALAVYNWIKDHWTAVKNRVSGIKISAHVCPHDTGENWNCKTDPRSEYVERSWWS